MIDLEGSGGEGARRLREAAEYVDVYVILVQEHGVLGGSVRVDIVAPA